MGPGLQVLLEPGGRIVNNTSQAPSQKWQQRALLANLLTILLRLCRLPLLRLNAQYVTALLPNGIKSLHHTSGVSICSENLIFSCLTFWPN